MAELTPGEILAGAAQGRRKRLQATAGRLQLGKLHKVTILVQGTEN